jgi:hypothetical protein
MTSSESPHPPTLQPRPRRFRTFTKGKSLVIEVDSDYYHHFLALGVPVIIEGLVEVAM